MAFIRSYISIFVLFTFFISLGISNILQCKDIISKSVDISLKKHLLCDYDTGIRPSLNRKNATEVTFAMIPKFVELDDWSGTFDVHAWTFLGWTDVHLNWSPNKFNNTYALHINTDEIWTPDISVHNSGDLSKEQNEIPLTKCELRFNGAIVCVAPTTYTVHCEADYTMWPYDIQNCTIQIASWSYSDMEITFKLVRNGIMIEDYKPNWQWKLVSYGSSYHKINYKFKYEESTPMITIFFLLERQASYMHSIYITPVFVLILLTLSTLWLDSRSSERITLACMNFICHLLAIYNFHWNLPYNGSVAPHLLIFYECSLILAALSLIISVILREIHEFNFAPPTLISSVTSFLLKNKIGQLLILSILDPKESASLDIGADDTENFVNSCKKENVWKYFAIIINWVSITSITFIYIVILGMYIPRKAF